MTTSDEDRFYEALTAALGSEVPVPDQAQMRTMYAYYAGVVQANRQFNLTRIVDPAEAAVKHFADAISLLGWVKANDVRASRVLDVGTGAGFPAVPLAIMRPDWQVTAIDSTAKKVRFVAKLCARLDLRNLSAEHRRAGDWRPHKLFDLVTYKAVGNLRRCVEQARELVGPSGYAIVYKTDAVSHEERQEAPQAARRLHWEVFEPYRYRLRLGDEPIERALWVFRK